MAQLNSKTMTTNLFIPPATNLFTQCSTCGTLLPLVNISYELI